MTRIDVVVPARDEEDRIVACLDALMVAGTVLAGRRPDVDLRITVVLDRCADGTEALVRAHPLGATALSVDLGAVGAARAAGVDHALRSGQWSRAAPAVTGASSGTVPPVRRDRWWIANTDADSHVPSAWLAQQVAALDAGAHVLVGAVVPEPADLEPDALERWRAAHPPGATLGHVHGANLGVRADAYVALGGFASVPEHEDVRLVDRARTTGLRVDATTDHPVVTSGRFSGRTPGGYAEHLRLAYGTDPASMGSP